MRRIYQIARVVIALYAAPALAALAPGNLTVLADSSLALPLTQLARDYTRSSGNATTIVILDGHDAAQQIAQGLDANLLITADAALLESLNARGLIDVFGNHGVARTQLALAAPLEVARRSDLAAHISFTAILYAQPNLPLYVTNPATLAGERAHQLMQNAAYASQLAARMVIVENHAAVMDKLAQTPGFALLLATDALREPSLRILTILPDDVVAPVNYQAVVVAGEGADASHDFLRYLESKPAQEILSHYGFQPPVTNAIPVGAPME